jgi:hypothetical protein
VREAISHNDSRIPFLLLDPEGRTQEGPAFPHRDAGGSAGGDYVYTPNTGAYTTTHATNFNGFPRPEIVVLQHVSMAEPVAA